MSRRLTLLAAFAAALLSLASAMPGIAAMYSAPFPPGWEGDAYGHLFKIWKLSTDGWKPWIREWYSGYPFLRFYPPLSYFVGVFFTKILGSPLSGYKAVIVLDVVLAALTMYVLLRLLEFSVTAATLGSIVYATNPWFYRVIAPEGNYARAMGIALAPLLPAALIIATKKNNVLAYVLSGLMLAAVFLSHHTVFVTCFFVSLFIIAAKYFSLHLAEDMRNIVNTLKKHITGLMLVFIVFLTSTAFWLIPFMSDHSLANFIPETEGYLFRFQSARPDLILNRDKGGWGYYQGPIRMGLIAAPLVLAAAVRRRSYIAEQAIYVIAAILFLTLSLGAYSPAPWLNKLPIAKLIPPYRWLDPLQIIYAISAARLVDILKSDGLTKLKGKRSIKRGVLLSIIIVIVLASILDARPQLDYWKGRKFYDDLAAALMFINGDESGGWRFYQWGLALTEGSTVGFSPALAHKPSLDGWYRQADPLYITHGEVSWALTHSADYARKLLHAFAVKYVILDRRYRDTLKVEETLREIGFTKLFESGSIVVYGWDNASVLQPLERRELIIGCSPSVIEHLFSNAVRGSSCYLDDYDIIELNKYSMVILYDYRYRSPNAWSTFLNYVLNGGTIIVDTYHSPDTLRGIPGTGVHSRITKVKGILNLYLWNGTRIKIPLGREESVWTATTYSGGRLRGLLYLGDKVVIGELKYGQGRLILVGLNLFYYSYLHQNASLKVLLKEILQPHNTLNEEPTVNLLEWGDGLIVFNYTAESQLTLRVSEAWYPYWRAYLDGHECGTCISKDRLGLIQLTLPPGRHTVKLLFEDAYIVLRSISLLATAVLVVASILWSTLMKIRVKQI